MKINLESSQSNKFFLFLMLCVVSIFVFQFIAMCYDPIRDRSFSYGVREVNGIWRGGVVHWNAFLARAVRCMLQLEQTAMRKHSQRRCTLQGRYMAGRYKDILEDHCLTSFRHKYYPQVRSWFQTFSFTFQLIFDAFLFFLPCWCIPF